MHIVIMGCGRTGATLAGQFEARGHTVAIIDLVADAFRRLPSGFEGLRITGVGFDRETLQAAGVENAYAFAAVSDGDNSNILAARVVRETYGVENVVARIADPGRAEVYRRLGIPTVAPVPWTSQQIVARLLPGDLGALYEDTSTGVAMRRLKFNDGWIGRSVVSLEAATGTRAAYLVRFGEALLPQPDTLIQDGDDVFAIVPESAASGVERVLSKPPKAAS
ncbi:potassium channel family protein [Demequina sp.]|uniref:potassium channel family protein n=1 Tax=Demequina sp. TaxID=2050685 RepID=UPI003D0EB818